MTKKIIYLLFQHDEIGNEGYRERREEKTKKIKEVKVTIIYVREREKPIVSCTYACVCF